MSVAWTPWRRGKCEWGIGSHSIPGAVYCTKRARWMWSRNGYIYCGQHKKAIEGGART